MTDKELFISELNHVEREGIDELIKYIESTDFFIAPATANYHGSCVGGLCAHSLNVYKNMLVLDNAFGTELNKDSIRIVALLHDFAKFDLYEKYIQNRKEYTPSGRNSDELGRFNWVQVDAYKVRDAKERENVYSEHGISSFVIANKFIKLEEDEIAAIINHHMGLDNGKPRTDVSEVMNRYPLASILCLADQASTYLDENPYRV